MFNHSVNAYSITNSKFQGINAVQHLKYQDLKLKQFLQKYKGMKNQITSYQSSPPCTTFNSKKTSVKIQELNLENVGLIADFGSESKDDHECNGKP